MGRLRFALPLVFTACGPSFQAVYEGDVHFEHCYALDQGAASADARKECWRAWLHGYTYGQSRDRVEYAATRFSQLSLGPTLPSEEARDARPRRHAPNADAPMPTSAFAPPPNLATAPSALTPARLPEPEASPRAPAAECSDSCLRHWTSCREGCAPAAAQRGAGRSCDECDRGYRGCVPACFHDDATAAHPARGGH